MNPEKRLIFTFRPSSRVTLIVLYANGGKGREVTNKQRKEETAFPLYETGLDLRGAIAIDSYLWGYYNATQFNVHKGETMYDMMFGWLSEQGFHEGYAHYLVKSTQFVLLILLAYVSDRISKRYIVLLAHGLVKKTSFLWDDFLFERQVFTRLSHLVPAIIIYYFSEIDFPLPQPIMQNIAIAYMIAAALFALDALLNVVIDVYSTFSFAKERPIKPYIQGIKIFIYIIGVILITSAIMNLSPWGILSGIGAVTAILMLVFKDSILGLVAGIQLTANKMVSIGDWIELPKHQADGEVEDITLTTVKVRNWDKTISTIPTYDLVAGSFKNWEGMAQSGGRRIKRRIFIDISTIRFCDEKMLEKFGKIRFISDYIATKQKEVGTYHKDRKIDPAAEPFNSRQLTNIGTFRAYIQAYLRDNPKINKEMTFIIRHLAPDEKGLPIEIYAFSSDKAWANYEAIQADIFDHLLAVLPEFELRAFQSPSGNDFAKLQKALH